MFEPDTAKTGRPGARRSRLTPKLETDVHEGEKKASTIDTVAEQGVERPYRHPTSSG